MVDLARREKLLHLLVKRLGGYGCWLLGAEYIGKEIYSNTPMNGFSITTRKNIRLADIEALFEPVYQCKDFADGWIDFTDFAEALKYHDDTGCAMRIKTGATT